jgi:S-adenosylmethionine-dependent methyltransferase
LSPDFRTFLKRVLSPRVPARIRANFRDPGPAGLERVRAALLTYYFSDRESAWYGDPDYLLSPECQEDMRDHVDRRLWNDRSFIVPWLDSLQPLKDARILEIGCGTGSSTVALAEQGAWVTGLDVAERSIEVAKARCDVYGVHAAFVSANASHLEEAHFHDFDTILFYASMEHMAHEERLASIKSAWRILKPGGLLAIVETPNRLWYFDHHTSLLPFFHWLPDELAIEYSTHSPRKIFNTEFRDASSRQQFIRAGRGVSYHEFEVSIGHLPEVAGYLGQFRRSNPFYRAAFFSNSFTRSLKKACPCLHPAWFQRTLDLALRKSTHPDASS